MQLRSLWSLRPVGKYPWLATPGAYRAPGNQASKTTLDCHEHCTHTVCFAKTTQTSGWAAKGTSAFFDPLGKIGLAPKD